MFKEHHGTKCGQYIHYNQFRPIEVVTPDEENGFYEIAESAFAHSNLQRVVITNFVKIREWAFQSCSNLSQVMFSPDIIKIDEGAFADCDKLTQIILPEQLTHIGRKAFKNCTSLREVVMYGNVKVIEDEAFKNCSSLERIIIPKSVTKIGNYAFSGCTSLYEVDFQGREISWMQDEFQTVLQMGNAPFLGCDVKFTGYIPYSYKVNSTGEVRYKKIPKKLFENAMVSEEGSLIKLLCKPNISNASIDSDLNKAEYNPAFEQTQPKNNPANFTKTTDDTTNPDDEDYSKTRTMLYSDVKKFLKRTDTTDTKTTT